MIVRQALASDLTSLSSLFDEYRQFYGASSNLTQSFNFLKSRFENQQCVIFIALKDDEITGFIQLYFGFSSVECAHYYILDDVYVRPEYRRQGAAMQLIDTAILFSKHKNAIRISVEAESSNLEAKRLYEKMGFMQDNTYQRYHCFLQ